MMVRKVLFCVYHDNLWSGPLLLVHIEVNQLLVAALYVCSGGYIIHSHENEASMPAIICSGGYYNASMFCMKQ